MAEEANPRSAVSVELRANMGGWLVPLLFSLLSFLDCHRPPVLLCDFHALPHGLAPGWAAICLLLPSVNVYATKFEVSFAGVFVSEERGASSSFAFCQFTIQDVFGNAARFHGLDMAKPAQASLAKHGKHTVHVGSFAHLCVWHSLFPVYVENAPQASHVEAV